jgi:hypothetical protein
MSFCDDVDKGLAPEFRVSSFALACSVTRLVLKRDFAGMMLFH